MHGVRDKDSLTDAEGEEESIRPATDVAPGKLSRGSAQTHGPLIPGKRTLTSRIRRAAHPAAAVTEGAGAALDAAGSSSGQPLPGPLQAELSDAVGAGLADVRIHTGDASNVAAESIGARAYTEGTAIHFAPSSYDPGSSEGRRLIAHEVAHTVQDDRSATGTRELGAVDDPAEAEADRFATAFARGDASETPVQPRPGISRSVIRREVALPEDEVKGTPPDQALSAEDRNRLQNAQRMLTKANQTLTTIQRGIDTFNSSGATALGGLDATFQSTTGLYDAAWQSHKLLVQRVAEYAAIEEEMLGILVSVAMGFVIPGAGAFLGTVAEASTALKTGVGMLQSMAGFAQGKALAPLDSAVNSGLGLGGVGSALEQPWANKLAFYKEFQKAWKKQATIMPFAAQIGSALSAVTEAKTKVDLMLDNGKTLQESPKSLEDDASLAQSGASQCAGATSQLQKAVSGVEKMAQAAAATKPSSQDAVEREIWIKWLSQLPKDNLDTMDRDPIENKLRKLDVWDRLGIDIGDYFSDNDQLKAKASARAVELINAHRGQEVRVPGSSGYHKTSLGDLGEVTYKVDQSSTFFGSDARGFVFDAQAMGEISDDILWEAVGIENGARKLIRDGQMMALVRTVEEWEKPPVEETAPESADITLEQDTITAAPPQNQKLSAADKSLLENAKQLLDKANANLGKVESGLGTFSGKSLADLQGVENVFNQTCSLYDAARHEQEMTLRSAGQTAAVQQDLVKMLVGAAFSNLKFSGDMKQTIDSSSTAVQTGFSVIEEAFGTARGKAFKEPVTNALLASGAASVPGGGPDWSRQLEFHQQMSAIWQAASALARLQGRASGARSPITELRTQVGMMLKNGQTLRLSAADIDSKAARAQDGAAQLGSAAASIERAITGAAGLRASAEGSAPRNQTQVLRELWIKWLSSLGAGSRDAMDQDKIENKLRKLGIWDQLGINIGDYFSDNDQLKAQAVARAIDMIMSHRGEEVRIPSASGYHQMSLGGELGRVTYRVSKDSTFFGSNARGYVVSAQASGEIGDEILWSAIGLDAGARQLIRDGNVIAMVRSVGDWDEGAEAPGDD